MSIKLQILLNFRENVSWKSTGNHTCWSVRHSVILSAKLEQSFTVEFIANKIGRQNVSYRNQPICFSSDKIGRFYRSFFIGFRIWLLYFQMSQMAAWDSRMDLRDENSVKLWSDEWVALLAGQRTCDSQVTGLSPGWAPLCSGLLQAQATYTCVPLSPSSIIWYQPGDGDLFGWESNRGPDGK